MYFSFYVFLLPESNEVQPSNKRTLSDFYDLEHSNKKLKHEKPDSKMDDN